jgi:stage V sporulation protein AA
MADEVYISVSQCNKVNDKIITIKDAAKVWCRDEKIKEKIYALKLYDFNDTKETRVIISSLKIVETIQKKVPEVRIIPIGETDVIIELVTKKKKPVWAEYVKAAFVCLIVFFGAAFTIMAFNNDVAVHNVFEQLYESVMGKESSGFTILEVTYSVGIAVGILVFYNHFGRKRLSKDPTPIEVEMRQYEAQINTTLIDGVKRKEAHIDVD